MLLADYVQRYALENAVAVATVLNYQRTERSYSRWLGRPALLADLSDDGVNRWLVSLQDTGKAAATIKNERANLLALWRAAYFSRLVEVKPDRIRKVHAPRTLPEAWDERQLVALVTVALAVRGRIRAWRMPLAAFFRAYILVGYDSGLRMSDMMALRWDQLTADGSIAVSQQKTGWPVLCRLRPETMAAIDVIRDERRPTIFGGCLSRRAFFTAFQRIVKLAGLEGTSRKLRRTGASLLERTQPGLAQHYLGHTSAKMAETYYIDQRISRPNRPLPPPIGGEAV